MVVLISEIEGNCFYIILSILLVWYRSDWFNVSLQISWYVSLPLHITLRKLVFIGNICFYYIMICPTSWAYTIGVVSFAWPQCIGCWLWTCHCSGYLFPGFCFLPYLLTRFWFVSCRQHICHRFCLLYIYGVLIGFEQVSVPFYCIWYCLLTRHWFVQCQQHFYIGVILQYKMYK